MVLPSAAPVHQTSFVFELPRSGRKYAPAESIAEVADEYDVKYVPVPRRRREDARRQVHRPLGYG